MKSISSNLSPIRLQRSCAQHEPDGLTVQPKRYQVYQRSNRRLGPEPTSPTDTAPMDEQRLIGQSRGDWLHLITESCPIGLWHTIWPSASLGTGTRRRTRRGRRLSRPIATSASIAAGRSGVVAAHCHQRLLRLSAAGGSAGRPVLLDDLSADPEYTGQLIDRWRRRPITALRQELYSFIQGSPACPSSGALCWFFSTLRG